MGGPEFVVERTGGGEPVARSWVSLLEIIATDLSGRTWAGPAGAKGSYLCVITPEGGDA